MPGTDFVLRHATAADAELVARLVSRLLAELGGEREEYLAERLTPEVAGMLASDGRFVAILAFASGGDAAGVLTLSECLATYARGRFGEIVELYVEPSHRSSGLGARLIDAARDYGRERGWLILEVGAPDLPRWQRSVDFYKRYGFREVGPRLDMRLT